jgi:SAM-dependent methyltransferase
MNRCLEEHETANTFRLKWQHHPRLCFEQTLSEGSEIFSWILKRNGFRSSDELREFLMGKDRILDAGCGNGRVTAMLRKYAPSKTNIVGIDLVSHDIAKSNLEDSSNVMFYQRDILEDLTDLGTFDYIYCQEVLHHTKDPERGFRNLCAVLNIDGDISVYVYKKKAPAREFVDDYVRERISGLSYEEAMGICGRIAKVGKALSEIHAAIEVPAIGVLDIPGGIYDVQRFFYHFFMKCFWNPELSFEENSAINYDWYSPQVCSRHSVEEVKEWFRKQGLRITREYVDFYGITVWGRHEKKK